MTKIINLSSVIFLLFYFLSGCSMKQNKSSPPKAKKIEKELTIHGDTRIDNYFWLNDRNNQEVIDYLNAENLYTDDVLKDQEKFQESLFNEIVGRIKQNDESVPYFKNGYYYYYRYEEGKEYSIYCRKEKTLDNDEEIILNVNKLAQEHSFFQVRDLKVSTNNNLLAFGVDTIGRRKYDIYIKDLSSGEISDKNVKNTSGSAAWANDNKTIFYVTKDESLRPYKIFRHKIDEDAKNDVEVYHEKDSTFSTYIYKSRSSKFLIIGSDQTLSTEYRLLDADNPNGAFKIIQPREKDMEYHVDHFKDKLYIRTNWNAKNYKLMKTSLSKTSKEFWTDVISHREDVLLENFEIFKNYLVLQERENGLNRLRIISWKDKKDYYIKFQDPAYVAYISTNHEIDTDILRYRYSSLTRPNSTFDFNMITQQKNLMKQQEVVGDFNSDNYRSERLFAVTKDNVKIPISLVYHKDKKRDNMPLLLYAYGSYGSNSNPYFSSVRLSLLDRGFTYAIAHVRGGQEMGRYWYDDGKLLKKKNTFSDFIDCGKFLCDNKYTSPEKLFAWGGSAGGLLIGAVANIKPDLFKGMIAAVPWVDVVTTMLDDSIPLTTSEYDEWGNPNIKEYYDYMLSYSPYDNVEAKDYPALLVTAGLHDSQVQYWEPAKWVAKLRELKTDNNLLLLKTDMKAGHGGTTGRFKRYEITSIEYAFLLNLAGINK